MELSLIDLLVAFAVISIAVYYYFTSTFNFWKNRGVKGPKPEILFGNIKDLIFNNLHLSEYLLKIYKQFRDEPMFGIFSNRTPILILNDPELVKHVLIKDFSVFADRGLTVHEKIDPLNQNLFFLEPERWRALRIKLSPTFTSGKLKEMFYLMMECTEHFEKFLDTIVAKNPEIECRDLTAKFTTDVIGVCAFGLKMNSLAEEESEFRRFGRKIFEVSFLKVIRFKIRGSAPWLYNLLGPLMYNYEQNNFFINSMKETMEYRKKNNIRRNDFVDLLMDIRDHPDKVNNMEMTDELLTAQAFVFFAAGFETSSTTISNALLELALNHSIQNKLREEIVEELNGNNGKLTFDIIKRMKYMDQVFCETLRKHPPAVNIFRTAMKDYTFAGTNVTIPKGLTIWIPVYAFHHDPEIYPDPDTFDPERFNEENGKQRHSSYYLPFGDGPRNCIGARFANYQAKVGLATILKNYKVDICDKTIVPYEINPRLILLSPKSGITLKFTKLT